MKQLIIFLSSLMPLRIKAQNTCYLKGCNNPIAQKFIVLMILIMTPMFQMCSIQKIITLQPNATDGKDAEVSMILPDHSDGNNDKLSIYSWTQNAELNIVRPLIEFDLSTVPAGAIITNARLSLSHNPHWSAQDTHQGNNAFWIQRITSPWSENSVTWNTQPTTTTDNQVSVPASTFNMQDYPDIDVTTLVQDIIANPEDSHGFMIKLQNELPYSNVILSSSDNQDDFRHPKIVITYTEPN